MAIAELQPNDRYAILGKTGSGKTRLGIVLAGTWARVLAPPWEVWWIDTKNDPDDLKELRKWGFRNSASSKDQETTLLRNALYYIVPSKDKEGNDVSTVEQVQSILSAAYDRKNVLVVVDEYVQAVPSPRSAGKALLDIFQRGRGRKVGIIGMTQEPVYVPRQLISQATHQILFSVTHDYDIQYVKKMIPLYKVPSTELKQKYGFYWRWVDGDGEITYYPNQKDWYDQVKVAIERTNLDANEGS